MKTENSFKLLGTLAIERGWLTKKQLEDSIDQQINSPLKLGEILIGKGLLSQSQLNELLELHTQIVFAQDELQFGRMAIKNNFVSKQELESALREQTGSNRLLGEILIAKGFLTIQRCNAILKSQERFLLNNNSFQHDLLFSCPNCLSIYKTLNSNLSNEFRCKKCGIIFEITEITNDTIQKNNPIGLTVQESNENQESEKSDFIHLTTFLQTNNISTENYNGLNDNTNYLSKERYDIGREIDRGGMGLILATKDLNIKREIVTKVLLGKYTKANVLRFIREAQINGKLEHPNIVPVHDFGMNSNGQIYFTMKWIKGETLRSILSKLELKKTDYLKKYTLQVKIEIVKKVCDALAYAHSNKIIHRDLKPENIMVGEFGEVQLMDWGLAKELGIKEKFAEAFQVSETDSQVTDVTKTIVGTCIGTPEYMSPEQADGDIDFMDERTDIYGMGGVLHSCISLTTPVSGSTYDKILSKVIKGKVNPLPLDTPSELVAIVKKAMAIYSDERYQTIEELSSDLTAFQSGFAVSVKHDSFIESFNKLIKRNKAISIGGLISIIALLSGLGVSSWQWKEAIKQKKIAENNFILAKENENKIKLEKETGENNLKNQKEQQIKKNKELALAAIQKGREYLSQAKATDHKFSSTFAIEKNRDFFNAANSFRQALIYNNENEDAKKGLYETGKNHFELSLWLQSFEQAESNIADMKFAGSDEAHLLEFNKSLKEAKNKIEKNIRERVFYLMTDAKSPNRKVIHEAASKELISLKNKLTIELLSAYIDSDNINCQKLAFDSLAWMDEPSVAKKILPFIYKVRADKKVNPQEIQVSALSAIAVLKPIDLKIYDALRDRIWEEPGNINSLLYGQIKFSYEPYAEIMSDIVASSMADEKDSDKWLTQGIKFHEGNLYQKALECFNKSIEINPKNFIAYSNRGLIKMFLKDQGGAILDFDQSIKLNPTDYAYMNRGSIKMSLKDVVGGLADYDQAILLNPKSINAFNNRGIAKKNAGDFKGALMDHNTAIQLSPNNPSTYVNRGILKDTMGDFEGAIIDFDYAIKLNPKLIESFSNRGNTKLNMLNYEEAILDFNKAIELNPRAEVNFYNRGIAKEAISDTEGAYSDFNRVIALNANFGLAFFKRGYQKLKLGDYASALEDFNETIKIYPSKYEGWFGKTVANYMLKNKTEFNESLAQAISLHPSPKDIEKELLEECEKMLNQFEGKRLENKNIELGIEHFKRGEYRLSKHMYQDAEIDFIAAKKIDASLSEKVFIKLLTIAFTQKNFQNQARYYEEFILYNPQNFIIINDYACFILTVPDPKLINLPLGLTLAQKAADLSENKNFAILDTLAFAYFKNKKFQEAVLNAQKVIDNMPLSTTLEDRNLFENKLQKYKKALDEMSNE